MKSVGLSRLLLLFAIIFLSACSDSEPIKVGFIAGTSGRVADLGVGGRNGVILAVEKVNAGGGVNGRLIDLHMRDDQQDPARARVAANELIDAGVVAILGPMTSSMAMEVVPIGNKHRIVVFGGTVATNELTGKDDYFFRVIAPTRRYASASAQYHLERNRHSFAIVYDLRNRAYTESWLNDFRDAVENGGGKVIETIAFESSNQVPFDQLAIKLLDSNPDCVIFVSNSVDAANLAQQVRNLDDTVAIAAAEWAGTERFIELAGRASENVSLGQYLDRYGTQPAYQEFRKLYLERFNQEPGFPGLVSYNAATALFTAFKEQETEEDLKQTLLRLKTFEGLQDRITFDEYGDADARPYMIKISNGKFILDE